jgi:hypothetical protein
LNILLISFVYGDFGNGEELRSFTPSFWFNLYHTPTLPDGHFYLKSVETRAVKARIRHKKWSQINPNHRDCHSYPPGERSKKFRRLIDGMQQGNTETSLKEL